MAFDPTTAKLLEAPGGFSFDPSTATPLTSVGAFDPSTAAPLAPKEEPGFTGSFASALKERIETAAPAAKLFFGVGDQAKSTEELLAARQKAAEEYKQTEFSDIGEAFRQGNYGDALSKTYDKFKEVAGTSFGAMAPAMGAGAAAAFAAPAAVPAALAGTAAYGITALGSYIADNIARQKEEQKARGKEGEDINRLTASAAATGQTALDIFGFKFFKPLGQLVGLEGKAAADRAAMEIVESATRPGAYRRAVATGAAKGIAFEVPQEVSQQLLERWQAGLEVNPFTDPSAAKEYLEAAGGALLLGGPMGATSRVLQTRAAKKLAGDERDLEDQDRQIKEEIAASTAEPGAVVTPTTPSAEPLFTFDTPEAAQERTRLLRLNRPNENFAIQEMEDGTFGIFQIPVDTTGAADVTAPISEAGGAGAAMPSPAGVGEDATGAGVPVDGGLDAAGVAAGIPDVGAGAQPSPLNALTPELDTYEQAQAVIDSLPNPSAYMVQETDYGFVVAPRPTESIPSVAPAELVGEAAPSPAVESVAEAVEPSAAPAVTEEVEAQPAVAPAEVVEPVTEEVVEPIAEEVITEEPSVAETTEAVEAKEERPQQAAPAATELETATNEAAESAVAATVNRKNKEAQQEQMRRNKALTTAVNKAITALQKLSTPVTPEAMEAEGFKDERAIALAIAGEAQRKAELSEAKLALFGLSKRKDLTQPNGKPWKARQLAIDAVANFTPEERAEFEAMYAEKAAAEGVTVLKSTRLPISSVTAPDAAFEQMTDAQQALRYIINKGNAFEKLLAQRLLSAVKGVKFVVIGPNTKIPDVVANAMTDTTQGVYYQDVIYVRDTSFGDVQGTNNTVVLHEALHAATSKKLDYALALTEKGLDRDIPLQAFVSVMRQAMNRAGSVYLKIKSDGRSNESLDGLYRNGAFTDIREFVSYGLTDKVMQAFLANIPGDVKGTSFFTKFVQGIRKLFNMAEQYQSALQDLIISTDAVLSMKLPIDANAIIATPAEVQAAKKAGKEGKQKADNIKQPLSAPEENLTIIGQLIKVRSWGDFKNVVSDIYNGTGDEQRSVFLGALTTRQLTELDAAKAMVDPDGKPLLDNVIRLAEDMNGAKTEMLDETAQMAKEWHQWQQANPGKYRTLNRLIHLTTINQVDPSVTPDKSKTLTEMYESLGPDGKALYNKIRDFYKARFMRYKQILVDRIESTTVDKDTRKKLLDKLEKDFENLPEPYFPLVREGKYWVRIGSTRNKNMEYYMFEDARERNFFVRQRAKELGLTVEELKSKEYADQFAMGDNYMEAIDEGMRNSKMVKEIADLIDGAKFSLITTDEEAAKEKSRLRDEVYQLYFSTLPEQNFRKHFLHRKGTAGFRADALRNFAKSSFHTSVQLAKIEYGDKIRKALDRAWDATEEMPQRDYLYKPIYREMKDRIDAVLSPEPSNAFATRLANTLGTASFVYYMSAPASAITNLTGLAVFGMPVLNGEFGPRANLALAKNMNIFKSVGVTGKDGKYTFPTLLSKLTGHRQQAYMEAMRRGKIDTTLTYDTLQLSRTSSDKYSGSTMTALNAISYLFHHSEKINREVMFMTAYDLAYDRAKKAKRDDKTAFEEAVNEASRLTDEAMFDYSEFNKPRYFRSNLARVLLQFKSFAQQTTFYLVKNFKEMFKGADAEVKKTAATKFIGTLGMTAMFAGTLGLPLVSVLVWAMSLLSEDDEDPEKRNPKLRFRNWLREEFGENLGLALERGPVSWATDIDFHGRVKLDQLWFRDIKQGKSEPEALKEFIFNLLGPSVGLAVNATEALRRINTGDVQRGVEMLLPAGVRGFATAMRYNEEGVRTLKDDKVITRDQLSAKEIAIAATGFSPTKIGATQEDVSQARAELDKVNLERSQVLTMFKDLTTKFTPSRRDAAVRALKDFNKKNPMVALDADTILKSIEDNIEASAMSVRGIRTSEKLRPMLMKILPPDPYGKK
jgi:hypothetical protein